MLTLGTSVLPGGGDGSGVDALRQLLPPLLMVAGVVVLGFLILGSVRRKIARRQADTPTPRQRIEAVKARGGWRDDADAEIARLLDTAQRLAGQLDAKAERLEQLIEKADERLAQLRGSIGEEFAPAVETEADPVTRSVYALADEGRSSVEIAQELDEGVGKVELILALRGQH